MPKQCPAGYAIPTQNFATLLRSLAVRNVAFPKRFNAVWAIPKRRQAKQIWLCNSVSLLSLRFRGLSPLFKSFAAYAIPMRLMSGLCNSQAVPSYLCYAVATRSRAMPALPCSLPPQRLSRQSSCGTMFIRSMLCLGISDHSIAPAHLISAVPQRFRAFPCHSNSGLCRCPAVHVCANPSRRQTDQR